MIRCILKGVLSALAIKLLGNCRRLSLPLLRIEVAKSYLQCVRMARLTAIGLVWTVLAIALICLGVVLLHAGLFILLPWTVEAKAALGMFLGAVYVTIGGIALRAITNEGTWMEKSGAGKMLDEATREPPGD